MKQRLQKILARSGHGSRRSAEALITAGRVSVNGAVVSALGAQADPESDDIAIDGAPVVLERQQAYFVMYKPQGVLTTARDPQHRRTVMELLPAVAPPGTVPVGRLDRDTEGLLLLTNDGEFAHRLAHPRYELEKEYLALVEGAPSGEALKQLRTGVAIEDYVTSPARVEVSPPPRGYSAREGHTWLSIIIHEGRKRQVRLMCAAIGHPVRVLVRTRVGDIELGRMARGSSRALSTREVSMLKQRLGLGDTAGV